MPDREVVQMALKALESGLAFHTNSEVLQNLRAALEQPEQEPECPKCKAAVLYECVACSRNNYPPQRKPLTDADIEVTFLTCNGRWDGDRWVIEDADFHPFVRAITALRAALEQQQAEPVALIRDGVLRWHIPHEHYSRPAWTAHGTHMLYAAQAQQPAEPVANQFNAGIEACMSRLNEMHRIASGRHNYYGHAALELAKLKGEV